MTIGHTAHLSDEAVDDVLIGLGSPEAEAHLAGCRECRERVEAFRADMQMFNGTMLAWSQARSATMAAPERPTLWRRELIPAAWVAAVTILLALAIPAWRHQHAPANLEAPNAAAANTGDQDTEAQIAEDNELMRSVDAALSTSEKMPVPEYYLLSRPHPRQQIRPRLRKP